MFTVGKKGSCTGDYWFVFITVTCCWTLMSDCDFGGCLVSSVFGMGVDWPFICNALYSALDIYVY